MSKTKTNTNGTKSATLVNRHNLRGPNGQFVSRTAKAVKTRTAKAKPVVASISSFINKMSVRDNLVDVVMARNPKIVYTYKPTKDGLKKVNKTIATSGSLGSVYNSELKGREVYRTTYR